MLLLPITVVRRLISAYVRMQIQGVPNTLEIMKILDIRPSKGKNR